MKISEIARICRISPRMLRHYDSIGLLKPAKVDDQTAYREYTTEQIPVLQKILLFKDLGFSLEEIKSLIAEPKLEPVLQQQKLLLEQRILTEQARLQRLEVYLQRLTKEQYMFEVQVKALPSQLVASLQNQSLVLQFPEGGQDISKLIEVFIADLNLETVQPVPHSIFWHESNEYPIPELIHPIQQAREFKYAIVKTLEPVPMAACLEYVGHYADDGMMQAFTYLHAWLEQHQYKATDAIRQVYHIHSEQSNLTRIELQIPFGSHPSS